MRAIIATAFTLLFATHLFAQKKAFSLAWASSWGSAAGTYEYGWAISTDAAGNVYTTGMFRNTVDFDPGPGTFNLTAGGDDDIFVTKQDSNGSLVWAVSAGNTGQDRGYSIAIDAAGNVYVTGYFNGTVDFDPGAGTLPLSAPASADIFVWKLSPTGAVKWAKAMGSLNTDEYSYGIAVDAAGNVHTTGVYNSNVADFDPGPATYYLPYVGGGIFVSKLDSFGNFIWAKGWGANSIEEGKGIALDKLGNVYTVGNFRGTVDFNPGAGVYNLSSGTGSAPSSDVFVSKLDSAGNFIWARHMGGANYEDGNAIAVDPSGTSIVAVGSFYNTADFDPGPGTANLFAPGNLHNPFVVKLDSAGNYVWSKTWGAGGNDAADAVAIDTNDNVYVAGAFDSTVDFDPGADTLWITNQLNYGAYFTRFDKNGNFGWAAPMARGTAGAECYGIAAGRGGDIYLTGFYGGTADFDPRLSTYNITSTGGYDIFAVRLLQVDSTEKHDTTISVHVSQTELDNALDVQLYPNPAGDNVTLRCATALKEGHIFLYSTSGHLVKDWNVGSHVGNLVLMLKNQPSGIYYIKIVASEYPPALLRFYKQ